MALLLPVGALVATAGCVGAAPAAGSAPAPSAAPVAATITSTASTTSTATTSTTGRAPLGTTTYVALTEQNGAQALELVDRRTGKRLRTVASADSPTDGSRAFGSVELLRDGTVFFVRYGQGEVLGPKGQIYGSTLWRTNPKGQSVVFLRGVISAAVTTDERRIAVTQVSPDRAHRKVHQQVRVGSVGGGAFTTLKDYPIPTDASGSPLQEFATPQLRTWLGTSSLIAERGCCDENAVTVLSATKPGSAAQGPYGDGSARTIGKLGERAALFLRPVFGPAPSYPERGFQAVQVTAAKPRGTVVWSTASTNRHRAIAAALKATRATPLDIAKTTYPHQGVAQVLAEYR